MLCNECLQCDVTYKTLSPEPRQTLSGFRHQLSALKIHCESQALAAWGTLRPWEQRGQWNPQKCPESKVQSSYPPILICIDNDIQRHYPLCPLYSYVTFWGDTRNVWVTRFIHIFGTHISIRTQVWWEMLKRDKKPLGQGGFTSPRAGHWVNIGCPVSVSTWGTHMRGWPAGRGASRSRDSTGPWTLL